jgi:large subunit ribosomal protein L9
MAKTSEKKSTKKAGASSRSSSQGKSSGDKAKGTRTAAAGPPRQPGVERRRNHPTRATNGHFQVLLTHQVPHLGRPGDLVKVRPGFARNYLLPQGLATFATPHNLRIVEKHRQRLKELEEARRADIQNLAAQIAQRSLTIEANANAEGHLYGSVNADQIAAALRDSGFPIESDNIRIEGPLRELGMYSIRVQLLVDIATEFKLWVVPTHTEEVPA